MVSHPAITYARALEYAAIGIPMRRACWPPGVYVLGHSREPTPYPGEVVEPWDPTPEDTEATDYRRA